MNIFKNALRVLLVTVLTVAGTFAGGRAVADTSEPVYLVAGEIHDLGNGVFIQAIADSETSGTTGPLAANNEPAPQCIYAYKSWGAIQVQNDCPVGMRVKVIIAFGGDSGCKWVAPNSRTNIMFGPGARIDGVVLC